MSKYVKGAVLTVNRETFTLLERTETTYPTNGEWALVRWRVGEADRNGRVDENSQYFRPIREVGTPNKNKPAPIFIPTTVVYEEVAEQLATELKDAGTSIDPNAFKDAVKKLEKVVVKNEKKHRGRPAVAMNELKAKNAIRDCKKGIRTLNDPLVEEAFDWMTENGFEKYLEKHLG